MDTSPTLIGHFAPNERSINVLPGLMMPAVHMSALPITCSPPVDSSLVTVPLADYGEVFRRPQGCHFSIINASGQTISRLVPHLHLFSSASSESGAAIRRELAIGLELPNPSVARTGRPAACQYVAADVPTDTTRVT